MPITALPPNAVQAIGSSQALSDSASVVKELIDNAIDGRATKISIEVSANALDDIRVKDNGHGIAPDDRIMICTRYCTSKIRDLHDLENIGGQSLGFRGEALASAAEMSGSLTITTRIEGEGTAVELKFDRKGQILSEKRTSHPVGTTVKVEKFLQNLPVRRQAAERMAAKMLAKVKRMLQAYALARPHLRLSLKILKAKDRKGDWTYPKSGLISASPSEARLLAVTDIFSKNLTSHCELTFMSWSSTGEQIDEATSNQSGSDVNRDEQYTLEAIVAKQDCDGSVLSHVGQYLSVDSRPVSSTRGTLKQIISLYKSHLRSATSTADKVKIVDPFLCLNIACPPRSYDANVEPAKDDVLFANSELLLGMIERLFRNIYGQILPASPKFLTKTVPALKPRGFELLLARKESPVEPAPGDTPSMIRSKPPLTRSASKLSSHTLPHSNALMSPALSSSPAAPLLQKSDEISGTTSHSTTEFSVSNRSQAEAPPCLLPSHGTSTPWATKGIGLEQSGDAATVEREPGWKGSMYADDEDEEADLDIHLQDRPRSPVDPDPDRDEHLRDVNISNPWAFAKLNAAMRPSCRNKQLHTPGRQIGDVGHFIDPSSDDLPQQLDPPLLEKRLPRFHSTRFSPEAAYLTPSLFPFPQKARGKRKADDSGVGTLSTPAPSNKERQRRGALDTWVQKSLGGYDELHDSHSTLREDQGAPDLQFTRDFVSARSLPQGGTPLSEIPDASLRPRRKPAARKQQQGTIDRPFIPPVHDPNRVWFDTEENRSQKQPRKPRPTRNHQNAAAAPILIPHDDEIEDDDTVNSTLAEHPQRPIHPDLAITLDYEARKQQANSAHRKGLRSQAAAASKAYADTIPPLHSQNTTSSPHKNRQTKAVAALHTPNPPSSPATTSEETAALDPSDPRAYLLRVHHQQGIQAPGALRGKTKRQKTAELPFETVTEENYIGDLTLMFQKTSVRDVEEDMKGLGAWDRYIASGVVSEGFDKVSLQEVKRWENRLRDMVGKMYAVEGGEGEKASVDMDLAKMLL